MAAAGRAPLEGAWVLEGSDGAGKPLRLVFGQSELAAAYLGIVIGRHPAVCDRVIGGDESLSRRHCRLGLANGALFIEDLHSLNGTFVDGEPVECFRPLPLKSGQIVHIGQATLQVRQLAADD